MEESFRLSMFFTMSMYQEKTSCYSELAAESWKTGRKKPPQRFAAEVREKSDAGTSFHQRLAGFIALIFHKILYETLGKILRLGIPLGSIGIGVTWI